MISYTQKHFTKNSAPFFPIMGEYEYSRTKREEWKLGIEKMKALGLNAVQSYCIWLHHEEIKGHFNFRDNNNLRAFIRTVSDAGMLMCLRVGPWVHAELRNGGFPDWIYEQGYTPRTNDPRYLADVRKYFEEIYKQCKGYFISEGGPIFSIQIENEFRHHTAGNYEEGERHINLLIKMLEEIGFDVPIYFATAWGNAVTGAALPTWGEYAAQPWEQHTGELPANIAYLIGSNPNEVPVGEYKERPTALGKNEFAIANVPYMTIEQGSGNQPTKMRRPIVSAEDNGAMTFCRLGQGLVGLGYYVFHGGINPVGMLSTTQEYRDTKYMETRDGYFCDLAERNYDFQAPVSMYNRITPSGRELKIWNTFATEFSDILCNADVTLGEGNATNPDDTESPRYSLVKYKNSGFLFYNNYLRRYKMPKKRIENFVFEAEGESIRLPDTVINEGEYNAFPFNLPFGNSILTYATATPLCVLNNEDVVVFNEAGKADFKSKGCGKVIVITKKEAKNAYKVRLGDKEHLIITDGEVYTNEKGAMLEYADSSEVKVYPAPVLSKNFEYIGKDGEFSVFKVKEMRRDTTNVSFKKELETPEYSDYTVTVNYGDESLHDLYLSIDFSADLAEIYIDGEKVNDMLYNGVPFEISMRYHGFPREISVRLYPLYENADVYLEKTPKYKMGKACEINAITSTPTSVIKIK